MPKKATIIGRRMGQCLNQKVQSDLIILLIKFLILLIMPFLNLSGESTHPFFSRVGTSNALNIFPSGALRRWYRVTGAILSSSSNRFIHASTYGISWVEKALRNSSSFSLREVVFLILMTKASKLKLSFLIYSHNALMTDECH